MADASGTELNGELEDAVRWGRGTLKLLGPAGTGKTSALVERFAWLVEERAVDPASVLFFVRDRRAAMGLRDRVVRRLGHSVTGPGVFTFHAFCWSLLTRGFPVTGGGQTTADVGYELAGYADEPVLLTAFDQRAFVIRLLSEEDPADWPVNGALLESKAFAGEVRDFLLRVQERLETPESALSLATARGRDDWLEVARFYGRYLRKLGDPASFEDRRPRLDFALVLSEARRVMGEHDELLQDLKTVYPHILVDELEEANWAELAVLEALLPAPGADRSAVVAGDPGGSVFAFRGADPSLLEGLETPEIVLEGAGRRVGEPEVRLYGHVTDEARGVVAALREAGREGVPWADMAVIVRDYRNLLGPLRRELNRAHVPHRVDGEALQLAADPVIRPILVLFSIACGRPGSDELWPALLASELGGFAAHELVQVRRALRLAGSTLGALCTRSADVELAPALAAKVSSICGLVEDACRWATKLRADECFWELWRTAPWFESVVEAEDDRRLDSLTTLADALGRFADRRGPEARMAEFIDTLLSAEFAPESVRLDAAQDAVSITTAHGSKGNEYELAVVAGCVEGMWPDPRRRGMLLNLQLLDGPKDHPQLQREALAEEERLFVLATSRSRRLVLTGQRAGGSERSSSEPSRFLQLLVNELPATNADLVFPAYTADELQIEWRRVLVDQRRAAADRLAVLWGLARLPGTDVRRWWWGRAWTTNDTPVSGEHRKTSYSRFSAYENCPLQYLYGQVLGLDPETTYHMAYGSLIHGLLEDLEKGDLPRDLDALVAEAQRRWRPEAYPPGAVSEFLKRDCREILARYLEFEVANGHSTLEVEKWFEFDVAGWTVRGKVDRIDRVHGNGLRVCDYKTSNSYKTERDVENDLQLSTYFLACKRDESLTSIGEPKIAELVFLRHEKGNSIRRATMQRPKPDDDGTPWDDVVERRLAELVEGIQSENFSPNAEADCNFCKFKPICPMWPEGQELSRSTT